MMRLKAERYSDHCACRREDFGCGEVLEILVIGDHIDGVTGTFEVVSPSFECFVDSEWLFVMNIIVAFRGVECTRVEGNWVQLTRRSHDGKYGCECMVGSVSFDGNWYIWHPMG